MFKLSRKSRSSKTWQTKTHILLTNSAPARELLMLHETYLPAQVYKIQQMGKVFFKKKFDVIVTWGCHQSIHHTWTAHNFKVTMIKHVMSASLPCHGLHMKILHKGIHYHVTLASPQHVCECSNNACTMLPKYPQIHNSSE